MRFFIPSFCLPKKYNYFTSIPDMTDIERGDSLDNFNFVLTII